MGFCGSMVATTHDEWKALVALIDQNNFEGFKAALEQSSIDVNYQLPNGTSLLHCAVGIGNFAMVKFLIEKGANVNCATKKGATPLHIAVAKCPVHIITYLLDHGAGVNARMNKGVSPLMLFINLVSHDFDSSLDATLEIIDLLIARGALATVQDDNGDTIVHHMAATKTLKFIEKEKEIIALYIAMLDRLLKAGVLIDAVNNFKKTPLEVALMNENYWVADLLVYKGSDINRPGAEGKTPVQRAIIQEDPYLVANFLNQGAIVGQRTMAFVSDRASYAHHKAFFMPKALRFIINSEIRPFNRSWYAIAQLMNEYQFNEYKKWFSTETVSQ